MRTPPRLPLFLALVALALLIAIPLVEAQGGLPVATVVCDQFLRADPDNSAPILATLRPGEPTLLITGRDQAGAWLVVLRQNGQFGWTAVTSCLNIQGDIFNAPWTAPAVYEGPPIATIGCTQYLRSAPSNDSARLLILYPDDGTLEIIGRDWIAEWLLVRRADGAMGWVVDTQCIVVQGNVWDAPVRIEVQMPVPGSPAAQAQAAADAAAASPGEVFALPPSPTPSPTPDIPPVPLPNATIGCTNYLRSAPNNDSARLLILYPDDGVLQILGRDWIAEWLLVRRADGAMGWVVDTQCIVVYGNVWDAPVTLDVQMPVPTPQPTAAPLPFPGAVPVPDTEPVSVWVNCDATGSPVLIPRGRSVRLELPWITTDEAQLNDWGRDAEMSLWVDGVFQTLPRDALLTPILLDARANRWYGGYFVNLGELAPGRHSFYWIMSLPRDFQTEGRTYAAGDYPFSCTVLAQ